MVRSFISGALRHAREGVYGPLIGQYSYLNVAHTVKGKKKRSGIPVSERNGCINYIGNIKLYCRKLYIYLKDKRGSVFAFLG